MNHAQRQVDSPARTHGAARAARSSISLRAAAIGLLLLVGVTAGAAGPGHEIAGRAAERHDITIPRPGSWFVPAGDHDLVLHAAVATVADRLPRGATLRSSRSGGARGPAREWPVVHREGAALPAPRAGSRVRVAARIARPASRPAAGGGSRAPPAAATETRPSHVTREGTPRISHALA